MWTPRLRYIRLGIFLLILTGALLSAWLLMNHAMFAVIVVSLAILAGLLAVARDGFRQTTPAALLSRGIDPTDDNYSPVSDSNLRRDWTPLFSATVSQRMASAQIRSRVTLPAKRGRPAARPAAAGRPASGRPAAGRPAAARPAVAKPAAARTAPGGKARQRSETLPPGATVNFLTQRQDAGIDELFADLDSELVGLAPVKQKVAEIGSLLMVDRARQRFGLSAPRPNLHMCFTGAPGTGKTTVALKMADLLYRLGYLDSGHLVHVMRDDLVGQYIGQTAPRTKHVLARAMGGVLFIDEAYSLFRDDDSRDYGQESVDILMQVMENERDQLVVILAGYKDRMERFFESNPGMRSRIAHHLDFAAYQTDELLAIGQLMLNKSSYYLSAEARAALRDYLAVQRTQPQFANARSVRNALERARLNHAYRLAAEPDRPWTKDDLMRLEPPDILPGHELV